MFRSRASLVFFFSFFMAACAAPQKSAVHPAKGSDLTINMEERLPADPEVVTGTLKNGMRFYIRQNQKPERRAELRLVVNAGSVLEDEDQQGLAHLIEHMAFNGTTHFRKQELVNYLESVGMRFGPDINAYTSFDETVFKLELPTDPPGVLENGFLILEDWAHGMALKDDDIDKERRVVIEEWRMRRGAEARIQDQQLQVLMRGSRYAERMPIGKKDLLETLDHDSLRRFYRDWYRPDLMAVVAVGDFDVAQVRRLVEDRFGKIPAPQGPRERKAFGLAREPKTRFAIASDPEMTDSSVSIYYRLPEHPPEATIQQYRQGLVERLATEMLDARLLELSRDEDPPLLMGDSGMTALVRNGEFFRLTAVVKDGGTPRGLEALLTQVKRLQQYGFLPGELDREKRVMAGSIDLAYRERDKTPSSDLASDYVDNFLYGEPIPGMEFEHRMAIRFMPTIDLEEVNEAARSCLSSEDRIIAVAAPRKGNSPVPTGPQLLAVVRNASEKPVTPYREQQIDKPLVGTQPKPVPVAEEEYIKELGITRWTMKNGVQVIMKPTPFKNDEVLLSAFAPGGTSLAPDRDFVAAETASEVMSACGVGDFDQLQLQKLLADRVVKVSPYIDSLSEGFSGGSSPQDFEAMLQLVHLYFTSPRKDKAAFEAYKDRVSCLCANRSANPLAAFRDTVTQTITQNDPRHRPMTTEMAKEMDLDKSFRFYCDRFSDASGFTFILVGSFDPEKIKPLVEAYLGSLPSTGRKRSWRDVSHDYPKGVINKCVTKGLEPKSLSSITFTGPFTWGPRNRLAASAMVDVLQMMLRERIREELGGTYGVEAQTLFTHYPRGIYRISFEFGSSPERVEELNGEVFRQIERLKREGATPETLAKVKEIDLREHETDLKTNSYWLEALESAYFNGEDPREILTFQPLVEGLTVEDIQTAARQYLNESSYVKVVLYPEQCAN